MPVTRRGYEKENQKFKQSSKTRIAYVQRIRRKRLLYRQSHKRHRHHRHARTGRGRFVRVCTARRRCELGCKPWILRCFVVPLASGADRTSPHNNRNLLFSNCKPRMNTAYPYRFLSAMRKQEVILAVLR